MIQLLLPGASHGYDEMHLEGLLLMIFASLLFDPLVRTCLLGQV